MIIKKNIAVIDFETTGFDPYKEEITEVGVYVFDGETLDEVATLNVLLKVKSSTIPDKVVSITGITKKMTEQYGVELSDIKPILTNLLKDAVVVAHNAAFDLQFLSVHFGIEPKLFYDTLSIARDLLPELGNHKLETVAEHYEVVNESAHRAIYDVKATTEVLIKALNDKPELCKKYINGLKPHPRYGLNYKPNGLRIL